MKPTTPPSVANSPGQAALRPDCSQCFALCCTAFGFTRSADFAIDKPPATPCPNLAADFSCTIHDRLRPRGFVGCTVFDCFGAGQAVNQRLFGGTSWREDPALAPDMFAAFKVLRQLHEMRWLLGQAEAKAYGPDTAGDVRHLQAMVRDVAEGPLDDVLAADVGSLHVQVGDALRWVSEEVRAGYFDDGPRLGCLQPGADLAGTDLRGVALCGANLRGACLIAADFRGADLAATDLLGADLRDARFDDADLTDTLFLTQAQITAARGSASTRLPAGLERPGHWLGAGNASPPAPWKLLDSGDC